MAKAKGTFKAAARLIVMAYNSYGQGEGQLQDGGHVAPTISPWPTQTFVSGMAPCRRLKGRRPKAVGMVPAVSIPGAMDMPSAMADIEAAGRAVDRRHAHAGAEAAMSVGRSTARTSMSCKWQL